MSNGKNVNKGTKDRREKTLHLYMSYRIGIFLFFFKSEIAFFDHLTLCPIRGLLLFRHKFQSTFFTNRHYVPFGVYYIQHYFQSTLLLLNILSCLAFITFILMSFRHYLPFNVSSFRCFLPFNVFYLSTFFPSTFCPMQRFVWDRDSTLEIIHDMKSWPQHLLNYTIIFGIFKHVF